MVTLAEIGKRGRMSVGQGKLHKLLCAIARSTLVTAQIFLAAAPTFAHDHLQASIIKPRALVAGEMLRGQFVQERQLAGFSRSLRSEGTFALIPGRGLIWRGEMPFKNTTVITDGGIVQFVEGHEATRLEASRLPGLGQLYTVLEGAIAGDVKPLEQVFSIVRDGDKAHWQLQLVPLHPDNPAMAQLKSLDVRGARFVDTIDVDRGGGDADHLAFLNQAVAPLSLSPEENSLLGTLHK
jgi:outer membrane lipoprotein carrier protein LolA